MGLAASRMSLANLSVDIARRLIACAEVGDFATVAREYPMEYLLLYETLHRIEADAFERQMAEARAADVLGEEPWGNTLLKDSGKPVVEEGGEVGWCVRR